MGMPHRNNFMGHAVASEGPMPFIIRSTGKKPGALSFLASHASTQNDTPALTGREVKVNSAVASLLPGARSRKRAQF
jgi:hypothetical protein